MWDRVDLGQFFLRDKHGKFLAVWISLINLISSIIFIKIEVGLSWSDYKLLTDTFWTLLDAKQNIRESKLPFWYNLLCKIVYRI